MDLLNDHPGHAAKLARKVHRFFSEHPEETGETYLQHLKFTVVTAGKILLCGLLLLTHGLFPFLFRHAVSGRIESIYHILKARVPIRRAPTDAGDHL